MRLLLTVSLALFWTACSHVVLIKSSPPGATVYVDDEPKGVTPLFYEEASGWGKRYELRLKKPGYLEEHVSLQQDEWIGPCLWSSICLMPFTFCVSGSGLLFSRTLRDEYNFLLRPLPNEKAALVDEPTRKTSGPKTARPASTDSGAALQVPLVSPEASEKKSATEAQNGSGPAEIPSSAVNSDKNSSEKKPGADQAQ